VIIGVEFNTKTGEIGHRRYSPNRGHRPINEVPEIKIKDYEKSNLKAVTGKPSLSTARKKGASRPVYP